MTTVGFEPTPFRTSALSWRLRPLGHLTFFERSTLPICFKMHIYSDCSNIYFHVPEDEILMPPPIQYVCALDR